jgi:nitrate reductase gamma subunit
MNLNTLLFGVYPYICLAVFLIGSWLRYDREPYTWRSESSQMLKRGHYFHMASNFFHIGILGIFFGHLVGLLLPPSVFHAIGIDAGAKQWLAIMAGGVAGIVCFIGLVMLLVRRLREPRIRATTRPMDWVVLLLLLAQLTIGLVSIRWSYQHIDGSEMLKLMAWARHIVTFRGPTAADYIVDIAPVFKLHLLLGVTLFLVFPFSRLVHIWSGFGSLRYLFRPHQIVRARGSN